MRTVATMLALLSALAASGCAAGGEAAGVDREAERRALLETDRTWAALASRGASVEEIVSFWTDDARIVPPETPTIEGKEAIRQYVAGAMEIPGFSISWEPEEVHVSASGDLGYTTGHNRVTLPDAEGRLVTSEGRYVTIWRKEPEGGWRCVYDIWNEAPSGNGVGEGEESR